MLSCEAATLHKETVTCLTDRNIKTPQRAQPDVTYCFKILESVSVYDPTLKLTGPHSFISPAGLLSFPGLLNFSQKRHKC